MVTCPEGRGAGRGVTIVIVIVSSRWSSIGREAGVSHKGEVESRWGLLHNYPRTPQYTSVHLVHNSPTLWYTWYTMVHLLSQYTLVQNYPTLGPILPVQSVHLIFQVFCVSEPCHMLLLHLRFVVHCH